MKIFSLFICMLMWMPFGFAYTLDDVFKLPEWKTDYGWFTNGNERIRPYSIIMGPKETILWIELQTMSNLGERLEYWASRNAYLEVDLLRIDESVKLPYVGSRIKGELQWTTKEDGKSEDWGWDSPQIGKSYFYNMVFKGTLPLDEVFSEIKLVDPGYNEARGYSFHKFEIKPRYSDWGVRYRGLSEMELRKRFSEKCQPMEGIYETVGEKCWRVACIKENNGTYSLEFLDNGYHNYWAEGGIKAEMRPTATPGLFKAKWWNQAFQVLDGVMIAFDGATMKVVSSEFPFLNNGEGEMVFVKMYPSSSAGASIKDANVEISEGTGFALKEGYLVTNYHVVDGASDVRVWREIGGAMKCSSAQVVLCDKDADLALLKSSFSDNDIPYSIATSVMDVGENVFALGFPLVQTMGKELKLTTGVISSQAGFMGDQSNYQISVAVQPGNSGGPLFNNKGVVVGVVVAKHLGAENANYAIKSSVLRKFLFENSYGRVAPTGSNWSWFKRKLTDRVKTLREYVYRIECAKGGSFSTGTEAGSTYPKVDFPFEIDSLPDVIVLTKVLRNDYETVLEFSSKKLSYYWLSSKTFLQYGNTKLKLRKVVGLPTAKSENEIPNDWQVRTFKVYFPPIPQDVEKVDFIEEAVDGGGTPFIWKGIHLK